MQRKQDLAADLEEAVRTFNERSEWQLLIAKLPTDPLTLYSAAGSGTTHRLQTKEIITLTQDHKNSNLDYNNIY